MDIQTTQEQFADIPKSLTIKKSKIDTYYGLNGCNESLPLAVKKTFREGIEGFDMPTFTKSEHIQQSINE